MRSAVLSGLPWIALAVCSQAASADDTAAALIDHCADSAPDDVVGLDALENTCPGLTQVLEESGYLAFLTEDRRNQLQAYELADLQPIRIWYQPPAPGRAIDAGAVRPILDELRTQQPEPPLTLIERLKRLLRSWFEREQADSDDAWLTRWLEGVSIPEAISRAIGYGSMILVILLALGVIINELYAAGYLRRRRGTSDADANVGAPGFGAQDARADRDAPAGSAPALLRMLVATLVESGRLRTERNLTHRELCAHAAFDDVEQRECFQRVAELAERSVYGDGAIQPDEIVPVAAAARDLNQRLSGAAA